MTSAPKRRLRVARHGAGLALALVLAACGGGERSSDFRPERVIAFGDETSVIDDSNETGNGRKYTVNPVFDPTVDCRTNPNWVQFLAAQYNIAFPQCTKGAPGARVTGLMRAQAGAKARDVTAQIDAFLAGGGRFQGSDLVTVLAGVNDVLEQYQAVQEGGSESTAVANVEAAGERLAEQVNRIGAAGGKVIIATIPDLDYSPFAITEEQARPGRRAFIGRLAERFNARLLVKLTPDGRQIGLVMLDQSVSTAARFTQVSGYTNVTAGACQPAFHGTNNLLGCNVGTVIPEAVNTSKTFLWADPTHLGATAQANLGNSAYARALNNPF